MTLAQGVVHNDRRPKEVGMTTAKDYSEQTNKKVHPHDEVMHSLERTTLLMVRGKRAKGVPILLPGNLKESTDMLCAYNEDNTYLFSRVGEELSTPLRAYQVILDATESALKNPRCIRCTKLRKHLATMTQLLSLKENELEQLANHMGHNVAKHREFYSLPMETILVAKVSRLLCPAQDGRFHEFQGKTFSDVSVCPEECLNLSDHNGDDGDEP